MLLFEVRQSLRTIRFQNTQALTITPFDNFATAISSPTKYNFTRLSSHEPWTIDIDHLADVARLQGWRGEGRGLGFGKGHQRVKQRSYWIEISLEITFSSLARVSCLVRTGSLWFACDSKTRETLLTSREDERAELVTFRDIL